MAETQNLLKNDCRLRPKHKICQKEIVGHGQNAKFAKKRLSATAKTQNLIKNNPREHPTKFILSIAQPII